MAVYSTSQAPLFGLLAYAKNYRTRIWLASLCSVINKIFDVMPEILIGIALDVVVNQEASFIAYMGLTDPYQQLYLLGFLTFAIWAGESIFEYLHLVLWRNLAQSLQHDLRLDAYAHVQNLDMAYFEDKSTGGLVAILNDDINQLERFLDGGANDLIQVGTTVIVVGTVFIVLSPLIALLAFTPIPVILWGAFFFHGKAAPLYNDVRERVATLGARLSNNLAGIVTIRSFTAEQRELDRLRQDSTAYCEANSRAIAVSSAFIPVIRMAILSGFLATFVVGGWLTLQGEMNVGVYGLLVFLTQRLLWPLTRLANTVDLYERAMASTRRILNLLETPIDIQTQHSAQSLTEVAGEVQFAKVSFAYATGRPVLHAVDVCIPAGKTLAFVGHTGSGKSTLMKLLLRFYQPTQGQILLDGNDISVLDLNQLRASIGLVSQDVFLFYGTVRDNIAYGKPDASDAEIEQAARTAAAHEFICELPEGYATLIGERGQKLSGGQRQRLSIARAVLKDPPILVLDEATSAVDNETEAAIQKALGEITRGRTTLIIAHRLSTITHADQIVVLDKGVIQERGTHTELLAHKGVYAALWTVQTGLNGASYQDDIVG